jgi:signal transduction histidine kinase
VLNDSLIQQIPWAKLGNKGYAGALAADPLRGGLWLGFHDGGVAYLADDQVRASYGTADGLGEGPVNSLRLDRDGTLWAATEGGLSRLINGRVATLTSENGLPCDTVHWAMEDDNDSVWLNMSCGLVRMARSDLDAWVADPNRRVQTTVFGSSDGVRSRADVPSMSPNVAKSADGRIWFTTYDAVSVIDPRHLPFNKLPPPVHIEQITADRKSYDTAAYANGRVPLPAQIRDLEIDYTALSLVAPEKVRFRYKLEGLDRDWHDAGNRRQAFYSNLPPRNYRFRVIACNNSGVWNEAGGFLDFSVAPAYYQTIWFRLSCVAAFLGLLWAVYQQRLRRVAREFNMRLDERVSERTRIARELHDTLLQSFQGLILNFQSARNLLPARPDQAIESLDTALDRAERAIVEGRDAIHDMRASAPADGNFAEEISALGEQLASENEHSGASSFRVVVEGSPKAIRPVVRDEIYRIAREALRNAYDHAHARTIEAEITYEEKLLRVRIRDDGIGINETHLGEGRAGHYGLRGMRERATHIGAQLEVWSEGGAGTEIELRVPDRIAYKADGQHT